LIEEQKYLKTQPKQWNNGSDHSSFWLRPWLLPVR
jgi:hypothetical protein